MSLIRFAAAATLFAAPVGAHAATLIDGSFEAKGAGVTAYCYDGFAAGGNAPCPASAWVGGGVIHTGNGAWGGQAAQDGASFAFVQSTQQLSQTFTATQGAYDLTWYDANRANYGGIQTYSVTLGSELGSTTLATFTSAPGNWVERSVAVLLIPGGNYTLSFNGQATDDSTAFIDNVALTAVPEPATWAMMIVGFGLVAGGVRRRRVAVNV